MKKLSAIALEKCLPVIQAIKKHPFNTELAEGTLPIEKFAYYIAQDVLYLRDFSRSLAMIASRAPLKFLKNFLCFSEGTLIAEQAVVHDFFRKIFQFQETNKFTPATLAYTSYLLQISVTAPVEAGIAAILPCFWVYQIVGQFISENTNLQPQNPYLRWIETYAGQAFIDNTEKAIEIFDEVALSASDQVHHLMLDAFYKSTVFEWHFWNDAYHQIYFDGFL